MMREYTFISDEVSRDNCANMADYSNSSWFVFIEHIDRPNMMFGMCPDPREYFSRLYYGLLLHYVDVNLLMIPGAMCMLSDKTPLDHSARIIDCVSIIIRKSRYEFTIPPMIVPPRLNYHHDWYHQLERHISTLSGIIYVNASNYRAAVAAISMSAMRLGIHSDNIKSARMCKLMRDFDPANTLLQIVSADKKRDPITERHAQYLNFIRIPREIHYDDHAGYICINKWPGMVIIVGRALTNIFMLNDVVRIDIPPKSRTYNVSGTLTHNNYAAYITMLERI